MFKFFYHIIRIALVLVLPFILLIRGSIFLKHQLDWSPWSCVLGGVMGTVFLLFLYLTFAYGKITGRVGGPKAVKRRFFMILILVIGFAAHGLFYLSSENMKYKEIRKEFLELHPILRIGFSTLVWFDPSLVVTDASRKPSDYKKMGLSNNANSLHFQQADGFVYAVDLRTRGRDEWKNQAIKNYFWLMGFKTLRHTGTADHLHVYLRP